MIKNGRPQSSLAHSKKLKSLKDLKNKYFIVSENLNFNLPGIVLENEQAITSPDNPVFCLRDIRKRGFPQINEPPRFKHVKREGRPPRDFEKFRDFWMLSNKTKILFQSLDPEAFEFLECETLIDGHHATGDYWLCDVIRVLDALDENASDISSDIVGGRKLYNLIGAKRYIFKEDIVSTAHVFRMNFAWSRIICDNEFKKACKIEKVKNIYFEPTVE